MRDFFSSVNGNVLRQKGKSQLDSEFPDFFTHFERVYVNHIERDKREGKKKERKST